MIEAGVLDDDKAYSIKCGFFFTVPGDSDPHLQICDGNYCAGFQYYNPNLAYASYGIDYVSTCSTRSSSYITAPQSSITTWKFRLEIHPNSTSGITYVSTNSSTHEYSQKLKPSQGLHFKVCRQDSYRRHFLKPKARHARPVRIKRRCDVRCASPILGMSMSMSMSMVHVHGPCPCPCFIACRSLLPRTVLSIGRQAWSVSDSRSPQRFNSGRHVG